MGKLKSKRGALKRFKRTKSGKIKRNRAFASHLMRKKGSKRRRKLKKTGLVKSTDLQRVKRMMNV